MTINERKCSAQPAQNVATTAKFRSNQMVESLFTAATATGAKMQVESDRSVVTEVDSAVSEGMFLRHDSRNLDSEVGTRVLATMPL